MTGPNIYCPQFHVNSSIHEMMNVSKLLKNLTRQDCFGGFCVFKVSLVSVLVFSGLKILTSNSVVYFISLKVSKGLCLVPSWTYHVIGIVLSAHLDCAIKSIQFPTMFLILDPRITGALHLIVRTLYRRSWPHSSPPLLLQWIFNYLDFMSRSKYSNHQPQ